MSYEYSVMLEGKTYEELDSEDYYEEEMSEDNLDFLEEMDEEELEEMEDMEEVEEVMFEGYE